MLGAVLAISHRNGAVEDRTRDAVDLARSAALNTRGYLGDRFDVLAAVAAAPDFRRRSPRLHRFLVDATRASGLDNLAYIGANGIVVDSAMTQPGSPPIDVSDRPYVQEALRGVPAVSDVITSRLTNRPSIAFAYPARRGIVGAGLQLDVVGNALRRLLAVADAGETVIVDTAGNVVAGPRPVRGVEPAPAAYPLARMRSAPRGDAHVGDRLLAFSAVPGTGWTAVVDRDYGVVVGSLDRALWLEIGALALFALLGVLVTLVAGRRLDRLDHARETAFGEQREIALTLQRSLMLPELEVPAGLAVSAHYVPAQGVVSVGGDWYDIVDGQDGRVALVVGDVAGHGLDAAATMGKLRAAARMEGLKGTSPADALESLYRFAASLALRPLATVAYAVLDLRTGLLRYALAGHPPLLLVRADGSAAYLDGGRSPLLGVAALEPRAEGAVTLRRGDTLVAYTDGLVERPDSSIDTGMAALAERASRLTGDMGTLAEQLVSHVPEPRRDDAAVLAIQLVPVRQPSSVAS